MIETLRVPSHAGETQSEIPHDGKWPAPATYRQILVPYDGSHLASGALAPAAALAKRSGATLTLVHAAEPVHIPDVAESLARSLGETDARVILAEAVARVSTSGVGVGVAELIVMPREDEPHDAARAILTALRATDADLLVMTTHGRTGAARIVLGSVADRVIRGTDTPVLLIGRAAARSDETWPEGDGSALPPTVLVALCGDAVSESALEPAAALAMTIGGGVELLRVVPGDRLLLGAGHGVAAATRVSRDYLSGQAEALLSTYPSLRFVRTTALVGDPARTAATITEHATEVGARAIAVATHGRVGLARLLMGSVTARVVATASVPVLVVPPGALGHDA